MMEIKRKFYLQLTMLTLMFGWGVAGIWHYCLPEFPFAGYPLIPIYFFLFGIVQIEAFDAFKKRYPQRMVQFYLVLKMSKLLVSIVAVGVYCFWVHEEMKLFLSTFIVFYLVYLVYETWFFCKYELGLNKKKQL